MSSSNSNSVDIFDDLLCSLTSKKVTKNLVKKISTENDLDTVLFYHINSLRLLGKKRINSLILSKTFQTPKNQIEKSLQRLNNRGIAIRKIS